ncbi:16S rRNA (adenine(1518)-N(6)/adenine(1519)-N(6))-dimethyltransferase RsmA [Pasteuria penetrans]|uniref:16S rRNA (adenine(1518)-N(6)/adenine(1519)-N(6))- dimethyltransferase RsmA n=1 Tax=Pasteuria penetrans TaxID=86005 RepID=UPI000FB54E81|nr:16S rRNA (adenine(1518)-N(6)/adenine(1519)-N(6))-dimethyltransferase RsmA [Pasteuria penetrans]
MCSLARRTRAWLQVLDAPRKSLGQNFLIQGNTADRIVDAAELTSSAAVLEIGPGLGALTDRLAQKAGWVVAVEHDRQFIPMLERLLAPFPHAVVVHGDALRIDLSCLLVRHVPVDTVHTRVVANLPYNIAGPLLVRLLALQRCDTWVVMLQKEMAQRLMAAPRSKAYGSLTVLVQCVASIERIAQVNPGNFLPQPRVVSMVLRLRRRLQPLFTLPDEVWGNRVVRTVFAQRRKLLLNALSNALPDLSRDELIRGCMMAGLGRGERRRAEELDVPTWGRLLEALYSIL